jgi:hypothetical protein
MVSRQYGHEQALTIDQDDRADQLVHGQFAGFRCLGQGGRPAMQQYFVVCVYTIKKIADICWYTHPGVPNWPVHFDKSKNCTSIEKMMNFSILTVLTKAGFEPGDKGSTLGYQD